MTRKKPLRVPGAASTVSERFLNREYQWLEFNRRVLFEAQDKRNPLLERLRFLRIFSTNLDEFFMRRAGLLQRQSLHQSSKLSQDGRTPAEQLKTMRSMVKDFYKQRTSCLEEEILPLLTAEGVEMIAYKELTEKEKKKADTYFRNVIFPILTPIAVDVGHPFPFISNLSLSLGVRLQYPKGGEDFFARVKIPRNFAQFIPLSSTDTSYRFLALKDLVRANLSELFPGLDILDINEFRVTRNAEIDMEEKGAEDLVEVIEEKLRERRFAEIVRLEVEESTEDWNRQFLANELELSKYQIYDISGELDYTIYDEICSLDIPALKYPSWKPVVPVSFTEEQMNLFQVIRQKDILVHHPYESFSASTEKFIQQAVDDPKVIAIKMTIYRVGDDTPFGPLLIRAAEQGKQVVVLVELQARFDEERNIFWAERLEDAGVHVIYGIQGLKTHSKTVLVVRQEGKGVRCYAHVGTGNYHHVTSRIYEDFGLFTSQEAMTEDLVHLFHFLTGRAIKQTYTRLLVAPLNMKEKIIECIENEIKNAQAGKAAGLVFKCNGIEEPEIIEKLYEASSAGVSVVLIIRGICCLKPGVKGLSDNIKVYSVLGRFLEHSRVYHFVNGCEDASEGLFYIGSADLMGRNLNSRVEICTPIDDPNLKKRVDYVLKTLLKDKRQVWEMQADGSYKRLKPGKDDTGVHQVLMENAKTSLTKSIGFST